MKKIIFLITIALLIGKYTNAQTFGQLKDERDGKIYKTITIGEQVWIAENLNYEAEGSWCYENKPENCQTYGRLYSLEAALKSCPTGWHLPSDDEWKQLEKHLGMSEEEADKDRTWRGTDQGQQLVADSSLGFNVLPAGYRNPPANNMLQGMQAFFWTSTVNHSLAYMRQFYDKQAKIFRRVRPKTWAFSVRCVKDKND